MDWVGRAAWASLGAAAAGVALWLRTPTLHSPAQEQCPEEPRVLTLYSLWTVTVLDTQHARDVTGYGPDPPDAKWPGGALVALNFVLNVEEGSEPSVPDGDSNSSAGLCECGSDAPDGVRDLAAEGMFAYGARCGVWRVLRTLAQFGVDPTIFACALALERNPALAKFLREGRSDICCHGWRWEDHIAMDESTERDRIAKAVKSLHKTVGSHPTGWYCRTAPSINTRRLLVEHGGFVYDSDAYDDDLPYWREISGSNGSTVWHLVVPYTLTNNDSKFAPGRAFSTADDFFTFMRDALQALVDEAAVTGRPKMMSVGLHPRLIGHPARIAGLSRFLTYVQGLGNTVWTCRRIDIAEHWRNLHPPPGVITMQPLVPSPRRLLVTGGAGFVLSHVVDRWLDSDPQATAVIFDQGRAWDHSVRALLGRHIKTGRLGFFDGDVARAQAWDRLTHRYGSDFTHVVVGAAITPTPIEEERLAAKIIEVNYRGVLLCLEWARRHCPRLARVIHVSSDAVLGVNGLVSQRLVSVAAETTRGPELPIPTHPIACADAAVPEMSMYALAKVAGEASVRRWRELFGMDVLSVRFSDVYGALDRDTGSRNRHNGPYWLCQKVLRIAESGGEAPRISIAGTSLDERGWDIIDAPSVARAVVAILQHQHRPRLGLYHIGLGRTPTHREVVDAVLPGHISRDDAVAFVTETAVADASSKKDGSSSPAAVTGAVDLASLSSDHWLLRHGFDVEPMKEEFGWEPTPLEAALQQYLYHLKGESSS